MHFYSPTLGKMSLEEMIAEIYAYMKEKEQASYKVIVGTDSHTTRRGTLFITAVIVQRIGQGARFFYRRSAQRPMHDLRHRIYRETEMSLELSERLMRGGFAELQAAVPLEIHVDIGTKGETKQLIQEVVGWVNSVGFTAKIKPQSFGASSVADRYTSGL